MHVAPGHGERASDFRARALAVDLAVLEGRPAALRDENDLVAVSADAASLHSHVLWLMETLPETSRESKTCPSKLLAMPDDRTSTVPAGTPVLEESGNLPLLPLVATLTLAGRGRGQARGVGRPRGEGVVAAGKAGRVQAEAPRSGSGRTLEGSAVNLHLDLGERLVIGGAPRDRNCAAELRSGGGGEERHGW